MLRVPSSGPCPPPCLSPSVQDSGPRPFNKMLDSSRVILSLPKLWSTLYTNHGEDGFYRNPQFVGTGNCHIMGFFLWFPPSIWSPSETSAVTSPLKVRMDLVSSMLMLSMYSPVLAKDTQWEDQSAKWIHQSILWKRRTNSFSKPNSIKEQNSIAAGLYQELQLCNYLQFTHSHTSRCNMLSFPPHDFSPLFRVLSEEIKYTLMFSSIVGERQVLPSTPGQPSRNPLNTPGTRWTYRY